MRLTARLILIVSLLVLTQSFQAALAPQPNIGVNGYFSNDKAQRGRTIQAAIVIDIPSGYHVNANPASSKDLIPTALTFDGYDLKQLIYPKPHRFKPKFAEEAIEVYQGTERIVALFPNGSLKPDTRLRGTLSAQACTEEICLPPAELPFSN